MFSKDLTGDHGQGGAAAQLGREPGLTKAASGTGDGAQPHTLGADSLPQAHLLVALIRSCLQP